MNNYDIVSDLYDVYVKFDFDIGFFTDRYSGFGGTVLELMVGTGRLSIPLLRNGVSLDCVDLSGGLLDRLQRKLTDNNLDAQLLKRDIRTLDLARTYDAVIIACNSFAEIVLREDRKKVLRSVNGLLRENGELIITLHNPAVRRKSIDRRVTHVDTFRAEDKTVAFSVASIEDSDAVVHLNQFYEVYDGNGCMVEKKMITLDFALIGRDAIEQELLCEGFEIKELYGNYDKSEHDDAGSPYLIIVAVKKTGI